MRGLDFVEGGSAPKDSISVLILLEVGTYKRFANYWPGLFLSKASHILRSTLFVFTAFLMTASCFRFSAVHVRVYYNIHNEMILVSLLVHLRTSPPRSLSFFISFLVLASLVISRYTEDRRCQEGLVVA